MYDTDFQYIMMIKKVAKIWYLDGFFTKFE